MFNRVKKMKLLFSMSFLFMLMQEAFAFENDEVFQIPSASIRSGKLKSKIF